MQHCKTHSNVPSHITISNAAFDSNSFAGVVLAGSVDGWGEDSSTDAVQSKAAATTKSSKFVAKEMVLGDPKFMVIGLTAIMGVDVTTYKDLKEEKAIQKMKSEFKKSASAEFNQILEGIINGAPGIESLAVMMAKPKIAGLKAYGLLSHHVLAIRVYTSDCHKSINDPLRTHNKEHPRLPHPFAATVYYITHGLRKLQAASGDDTTSSSESIYWRGVADVGIADDFKSGTEMGLISTSTDPKVAALGFTDDSGFIFQYVCNDFASKGQDVSFMSVYGREKEVLFPPLTYLNIHTGSTKVNRKAQVKIDKIMRDNNRKPLKVVTVRPTYPKE